MRLWRISNHADLSGEGGRLAAGRWHRRGRRVVYLAEHPALALLETLVHLEIDPQDLPAGFTLLTVEAPDDLAVTELTEAELDASHPDWRGDVETTRTFGDGFLAAGRTALLRVPSALVPAACNLILNPEHPAAGRVRIVARRLAAFDERLLQRPRT